MAPTGHHKSLANSQTGGRPEYHEKKLTPYLEACLAGSYELAKVYLRDKAFLIWH